MNKRLRELRELGQSVWLDALSRDDIQTGDLQLFIEDGVLGITSNPTMFQRMITASSLYNGQIGRLLSETSDPRVIFRHLAVTDVQDACDLFLPTFQQTERRDDGCVALEVAPWLAYDTEATIERARVLWEMVDRPNLFISIPATDEGLAAIEECVADGLSVSPTLIFSVERYRQVAEAYLRGCRRRLRGGGDLSTVGAVALFFISRLDTEADERLIDAGREDLRGQLGIANAKLAYQEYQRIFSGAEWEELASQGASPQRLLWASTSTKYPGYEPIKYVDALIGPDTATTLPKGTLAVTMDNVEVRPTLEEGIDDARRFLEELAAVGVSYDDVIATLEDDGVKRFIHSYEELMEEVRQRSNLLSGGRRRRR